MVTDVGRSAKNNAASEALIDSVRRQIADPSSMLGGGGASGVDKIEVLDLIGAGSVSLEGIDLDPGD